MTTAARVIHSDPDMLVGGTPVFVGTRVPVKTLLDYLEAGNSLNEFLDHFLSVQREQAIVTLEGLNLSWINSQCSQPFCQSIGSFSFFFD